MKLWILKPKSNVINNPWAFWHDDVFGFVICAKDVETARQIAHENGGQESDIISPWLDSQYSICIELVPKEPGVVLYNFEVGIRGIKGVK